MLTNHNNKTQSFQNTLTFLPISIHYLTQMLSNINWIDRIYKLDNLYIFKFNVTQFLSSNLATEFVQFIRQGLKYVTLKTYSYLYHQAQPRLLWDRQLMQSSQQLKVQYCNLMGKIKQNKKVFVLDILIFMCSLLSRQFLGNLLQQSRQKQSKTQTELLSELQNLEKLCLENTDSEEQKNLLLVQQYTFIIITYQTTGNKVSPNSFEYMKNKFAERNQISHKCSSFFVSLKIIRQHIQKKKNQIQIQIKNDSSQVEKYDRYSDKAEEYLASVLQLLGEKQDQVDRKSIFKEDKVSLSLHQLLQAHSDNDQPPSLFYNKLQKINQVKLSKAAQYSYKIKEKDLSLLERNKKKSESLLHRKNRHNFWRQIKSVQKPIFHLKNKNIESNGSISQQRKNWDEILKNEKKKFKRSGIQIQKFKSKSDYIEGKQRTSRSNSILSLKKIPPKFLPTLPSPQPPISLQQSSLIKKPCHSQHSTPTPYTSSYNSYKQSEVQYIFHEINENTVVSVCSRQMQRKLKTNTDFRGIGCCGDNLKKRGFDLKKFKKAFDLKCQQRHRFVEKSAFLKIL